MKSTVPCSCSIAWIAWPLPNTGCVTGTLIDRIIRRSLAVAVVVGLVLNAFLHLVLGCSLSSGKAGRATA